MDELTIPFLGEPRSSWQYPFGSLFAAGAQLAAGSDWPVSSVNPFEGIHVAVNRRLPEYGSDVPAFLPDQQLDLATALTAYTAGSARVVHLDESGVIEPGRLADLAVLERDPFAGPTDDIATTRVVATYVEGEPVYEA
jgi:predicted amidohydrolase YtcJ